MFQYKPSNSRDKYKFGFAGTGGVYNFESWIIRYNYVTFFKIEKPNE